MNDKLKENINKLFYGFMKEARRSSFMEFLENWEITYEEYEEVKKHFAEQGIKLG